MMNSWVRRDQGTGSAARRNQIDAHGQRHLRRALASHLMQHILEEAKRRAYRRLSLETGSAAAFAPARNLYASHGFTPCAPFADYVEDPYSVFMTREIAQPARASVK